MSTAADLHFPGRMLVTVAFAMLAPGWALVAFAGLTDPVAEFVAAVGASAAIGILIAMGQVLTGQWHPLASIVVLCCCTAIGLVRYRWSSDRWSPTRAAVIADRSHARPGPAPDPRWLCGALALVGVLFWVVGALRTDPRGANGFGLVSVLAWPVWVGLALTLVAVLIAITTARPGAAATSVVLLAVLLIELFGIQPFTERLPRTATVWVHLGFADRFAQTGLPAHGVDARFSWPGFFAWNGWLQRAGGTDLHDVANWTPVLVALVFSAATAAVAGRLGFSRRISLLAALVVSLGDWIEQDYFSPQATALFLSVATLVLLLNCGARVPSRRPDPATDDTVVLRATSRHRVLAWFRRDVEWMPPGTHPRRATVALLVILLMMAAMVCSHQLSPALLAAQLMVLIIAGCPRAGTTFILLCGLEIAWLVLGAQEFWININQLGLATNSLGEPGQALTTNLVDRLGASDPGLAVGRALRLVLFLAIVALAVCGYLVGRRRGAPVRLPAALAVAPWPVAFMQSYGGEMFMRCALFSLPWLAVLAGVALNRVLEARREVAPTVTRPFLVRFGAVLSIVAVLATTLVVTRGGNDGFAYISTDELMITTAAANATPEGGIVLLAGVYGPGALHRVGSITWTSVETGCPKAGAAVAACAHRIRPDTVVFTHSMTKWGILGERRPPNWAQPQIDRLLSEGYHTIAHNRDGIALLRDRTEPTQ